MRIRCMRRHSVSSASSVWLCSAGCSASSRSPEDVAAWKPTAANDRPVPLCWPVLRVPRRGRHRLDVGAECRRHRRHRRARHRGGNRHCCHPATSGAPPRPGSAVRAPRRSRVGLARRGARASEEQGCGRSWEPRRGPFVRACCQATGAVGCHSEASIGARQRGVGRARPSRSEVDAAIRRDPQDWRLWLIRARIETKLGAIRAATASLRHAAELNPRSPLVRSVTER